MAQFISLVHGDNCAFHVPGSLHLDKEGHMEEHGVEKLRGQLYIVDVGCRQENALWTLKN